MIPFELEPLQRKWFIAAHVQHEKENENIEPIESFFRMVSSLIVFKRISNEEKDENQLIVNKIMRKNNETKITNIYTTHTISCKFISNVNIWSKTSFHK